jgi:diguanylate cyclase (GGDEF)-like protein
LVGSIERERQGPDTAGALRARRRGRNVALWALVGAGAPASVLALAARALGHDIGVVVTIVVAAIGAGLATWTAVRDATRRMDAASRMLEQRIVATATTARREAEISERERRMGADLAKKTSELEQRLRERALLFDVLRESVSSHDLDQVLGSVAERLGPALRFREVAVLLRESERLSIRAAWGFTNGPSLVGRSIAIGEGLTGEAAAKGAPMVVPDVTTAPEYLAFWDEVPRTGSFVTVPIQYKEKLIGMLALTRPPSDPLTDLESRYLRAVADQVALAIRNAQLITELEERATHDPLTSLANRRLLEERLERSIAESRRYGEPLSLLAIDVDHFKLLNDRCGHPAGDQVLVARARALESGVRTTDTVARVGGEEFVVLLTRADAVEAARVAEELRGLVAGLELASVAEQPLGHLSVSVGVAQLADGETAAELASRADAALYDAKRRGRDRVSTFPPPADDA